MGKNLPALGVKCLPEDPVFCRLSPIVPYLQGAASALRRVLWRASAGGGLLVLVVFICTSHWLPRGPVATEPACHALQCRGSDCNVGWREKSRGTRFPLCEAFRRPAFPRSQPLSDYLQGEEPVPRGHTGWPDLSHPSSPLEEFLANEQRERLFIARVIGNDLWPMTSPCRSRINLRSMLQPSRQPKSLRLKRPELLPVNLSGGVLRKVAEVAGLEDERTFRPPTIITDDKSTGEWTADDKTMRLSSHQLRAALPRTLRVMNIWAPFRILNSTEHILILHELVQAKQKLIFSVPLDIPSLALASSYVGYILNFALARQVVWRETNLLGARWTLLLDGNHDVPKAALKGLSKAIEAAEQEAKSSIFVPVLKSFGEKGQTGKEAAWEGFARLPPVLLLRFSAPSSYAVSAMSSNPGVSWFGGLLKLQESDSLHCREALSPPNTSTESIGSLVSRCGFVVERPNWPQDQDGICHQQLPISNGRDTLLSDLELNKHFSFVAADVIQRLAEVRLNNAASGGGPPNLHH